MGVFAQGARMTPHEEFAHDFGHRRMGRTLIVGSHVYPGRDDRRAYYNDVVGVDAIEGPGVDRVVDLEEASPDDLGLFSHVECRSVLEHARRPWLVAANIEGLLEPGGTLDLAVPFVWSLHSYPGDFWRFTVAAVRSLFARIEWRALRYAHRCLDGERSKTPRATVNGHVFIARTEVLGFGVRA